MAVVMKDIELLHEVTYGGGDIEAKTQMTGSYGPHLLLDCHQCDPKTFTRMNIRGYMKVLCEAIGMKREKLHFWDDKGLPKAQRQTEPHAVGTSAVQFIITSSIVIHTLTKLKRVYVDIFSCRLFDDYEARRITQDWFKAKDVGYHLVERK